MYGNAACKDRNKALIKENKITSLLSNNYELKG
jgi:hypothetical protein